METKEKKAAMGSRGSSYSKRLPFYDNEDGMRLLHELARRRGVKASALLRTLVREEADREGIPTATPGPDVQPVGRDGTCEDNRPIWEIIDELRRQVPEEDLATLPTDLAEQHDHYLYGTPKR